MIALSLRYDTDLGFTVPDSGFGTPTVIGWIRTGSFAGSVEATPGAANCDAWTSAAPGANGTVVAPGLFWNTAGLTISPWAPGTIQCDATRRVWCVQD